MARNRTADYKKGKIYRLYSLSKNLSYYGSTADTLASRFSKHKYEHKNKRRYCYSFLIFDCDDCVIELIENYPCNNRSELEKKEGEYIKNNECVNNKVAGRNRKILREERKQLLKKEDNINYYLNGYIYLDIYKMNPTPNTQMDEYEHFINSMLTKSMITQKNYISKYNILKALFNTELKDVSQEKVIKVLKEEYPNVNTQQGLMNIFVVIRKLYNMPTDKLESYRKGNREMLKQAIVENNKVLVETLPEYDALLEYLNDLYQQKEWRAFIINYLLIYCNTRNQDLIADIVTKVADGKDPTKNFIVFQPRLKTATFIRNVYKTAHIVKPDDSVTGYGPISIKIKNNLFSEALKQLLATGETELIPNTNTLAYTIKRYTYKGLGEGNIFKIVVNHFRNDIDMLQQIAMNRGTSMVTMLQNYDIELKNKN